METSCAHFSAHSHSFVVNNSNMSLKGLNPTNESNQSQNSTGLNPMSQMISGLDQNHVTSPKFLTGNMRKSAAAADPEKV